MGIGMFMRLGRNDTLDLLRVILKQISIRSCDFHSVNLQNHFFFLLSLSRSTAIASFHSMSLFFSLPYHRSSKLVRYSNDEWNEQLKKREEKKSRQRTTRRWENRRRQKTSHWFRRVNIFFFYLLQFEFWISSMFDEKKEEKGEQRRGEKKSRAVGYSNYFSSSFFSTHSDSVTFFLRSEWISHSRTIFFGFAQRWHWLTLLFT